MNIKTVYTWFCVMLGMMFFASTCSENDPRSPKSPIASTLTAEQQHMLEEGILDPIYVSNASSIHTASVVYRLPEGHKHFELAPKITVNLPATVNKITARFLGLSDDKTKHYPSPGERVRLTHSGPTPSTEKKLQKLHS